MTTTSSELLQQICDLTAAAGQQIMEVYGRPHTVTTKDDKSPLTEADQVSHACIMEGLTKLAPKDVVVSEEGIPDIGSAENELKDFWLVDPLDGTKEFIKRTGEFTVNIARIQDGRPVLGVVHVPALKVTYFAEKGRGAWVRREGKEPERIRSVMPSMDRLRLVGSKDHAGPKVKALIARFPRAGFLSMGSSLKFCLVAEGKADMYLRDVPTMEWDTAAAHCVVEEAGGGVFTLEGGPLTYGKPEFRNPLLMTVGHPEFDWKTLMHEKGF